MYALLTDHRVTALNFDIISGNMLHLTYKKAAEFEEVLPHASIFLAAMTTSVARLKLYSDLEILDRRVLYFDTDSIIFTTKSREKTLPLGNFLGELTNEIPSGHITEFASSGPKNYAYKVKDEKDGDYNVVKVKGFSLNARTCQKINFDSLKDLVVNAPAETCIQTEKPKKIKRDLKGTSIITTSAEHKNFRVVYNKRYLLNDRVSTLPFGWK